MTMRSGRRRCGALAGWCCLLATGGARQASASGGGAGAAAAASFWGGRRNNHHRSDGDNSKKNADTPWNSRAGPPSRSIDLASASSAFATQPHDPRSSSLAVTSAADNVQEAAVDHSEATRGGRPERGKVLTELTPQQMYDAYRDIQKDYQARAFSASSGTHAWRVLNERDGVKVSMLQHPDDPHCPYVRMCGVIDAPVQECWNFLMVDRWDESMPKMDPFYEGVSVVGEYSHPESGVDMILCRKRTKRILAFGKRDLVFLSVVDKPLDDGTWVSGSVSVVTPHVPRQPGYTRAFQDSIAFYQPLDNNTRTNLTIVCRIDLNDSGQDGAGGWIPMWLYVKTIGVTAVESVLRMRHAIVDSLPQKQPTGDPRQ